MFCRFCGAGIDDDSVFCPECGKRLKAPDKGADPQRAEIEGVGSKQPLKADNVKSSVNVPYYICIGAYLLFVISCFLPTVSVYVAVSISQQYLFNLGFGGILMIISGITLIVSCFAYKKDDN